MTDRVKIPYPQHEDIELPYMRILTRISKSIREPVCRTIDSESDGREA